MSFVPIRKSFKYSSIKEEAAKAAEILSLYNLQRIYANPSAVQNAIRYYADLAEQYAASDYDDLI